MRVIRTGRGCYLAFSQSSPETSYAVNLSDYGGLGSCTCDDYTLRRRPRWRDVRKPYDIFRCKHIRRVRNFVLDAIVAFYQKQGEDEL